MVAIISCLTRSCIDLKIFKANKCPTCHFPFNPKDIRKSLLLESLVHAFARWTSFLNKIGDDTWVQDPSLSSKTTTLTNSLKDTSLISNTDLPIASAEIESGELSFSMNSINEIGNSNFENFSYSQASSKATSNSSDNMNRVDCQAHDEAESDVLCPATLLETDTFYDPGDIVKDYLKPGISIANKNILHNFELDQHMILDRLVEGNYVPETYYSEPSPIHNSRERYDIAASGDGECKDDETTLGSHNFQSIHLPGTMEVYGTSDLLGYCSVAKDSEGGSDSSDDENCREEFDEEDWVENYCNTQTQMHSPISLEDQLYSIHTGLQKDIALNREELMNEDIPNDITSTGNCQNDIASLTALVTGKIGGVLVISPTKDITTVLGDHCSRSQSVPGQLEDDNHRNVIIFANENIHNSNEKGQLNNIAGNIQMSANLIEKRKSVLSCKPKRFILVEETQFPVDGEEIKSHLTDFDKENETNFTPKSSNISPQRDKSFKAANSLALLDNDYDPSFIASLRVCHTNFSANMSPVGDFSSPFSSSATKSRINDDNCLRINDQMNLQSQISQKVSPGHIKSEFASSYGSYDFDFSNNHLDKENSYHLEPDSCAVFIDDVSY